MPGMTGHDGLENPPSPCETIPPPRGGTRGPSRLSGSPRRYPKTASSIHARERTRCPLEFLMVRILRMRPASHFALANAASSTRGPKRTEGLHEHLLHLRQTCRSPLRQMEPQRGFVPRPQRFVVPQSLRHLELTERILRAGDGHVVRVIGGDHQKHTRDRKSVV